MVNVIDIMNDDFLYFYNTENIKKIDNDSLFLIIFFELWLLFFLLMINFFDLQINNRNKFIIHLFLILMIMISIMLSLILNKYDDLKIFKKN